MQTSRKIKITTPANENQADFALFLLSWSLPEFIPGCTYTALLPGNLAHLLLSLPSVCAYLLVCRGSGVAEKIRVIYAPVP